MRKILTIFFFLVSVVLANSGFVKAQSGEGWSLEGEVLTITSNTPKLEVDKEEYPDESWYDLYAEQVTTLVFEDGVTSITESYIRGGLFQNLAKVVIGPNVETIGENVEPMGSAGVFHDCYHLTTVEFKNPSKLKVLNASTFFAVEKLESINLPSTVEEIGGLAFGQCFELKHINLEETTLRKLGSQAFMSCNALTDIILPSTIETIGDWAFQSCQALKSVSIGGDASALQLIGKGAFTDCHALETVPMIPAAQTEIADGTFYQCKKLKFVQFAPNSQLEKISDVEGSSGGAFAYSGIEYITLPKGLKYIGKGAFGYCESLITVDFEEGSALEDIADEAFWRSGLQVITLPETVKTIGRVAFSETKVKDLNFPDSIITIGDQAFSSTLLESIDVPASLTTLGSGAFQWCKNLKTATFRNSEAPAHTGGVFGSCKNLTDIYVPVGADGYKDTFVEYQDKLRFTLEPTESDECVLSGNVDYELTYTAEQGWTYKKEDGSIVVISDTITGSTTGSVTVIIPESEYTLVFQDCSVDSLNVESNAGALWVEGNVIANVVTGNIHMKSGSLIQAPEGKGVVTLTEPAEGGTYTAFAFAQTFQSGRRLPMGTYVSFHISPKEGYELESAFFGEVSMMDTFAENFVNHTITESDTDLTVTITFKKVELEKTPLDLTQVTDTVVVTYENNNWYYQEAGKEKVAFTGEVTGKGSTVILLAEDIPTDAPALQFAEDSEVGSLIVSEESALQVEGSVTVGSVSGNIETGEGTNIESSVDVPPVEISDTPQSGGSYEVIAFGQQVTDQMELPVGTPLTFEIEIEEGYKLASAKIGGNPLVESLSLLRTRAASTTVNRYYKITGEETDLTVDITFRKTETEEPDEPEDPDTPPVNPVKYYNIYKGDICDGVSVSFSNNSVKEGGSVIVYVEKDEENYTFENFKVYYKDRYYGSWKELEESTQPGEYKIKNIWNHIYVKAEGSEKKNPTGMEEIEGVKVYTKDGSLFVQTPQREQVIVISMTGAVVKNEEQIGLKQYHGLTPGIYVVRVGEMAYKIRLN